MRKDKILNQKGLALVTVFFIFLVALIVVGAIAIISVTEIGTTRTNLDAEQAFNLAEAGIDWAKAQFYIPSWKLTASTSTMNVPNLGGVVVTISGPTGTPSGTYTIKSSGAIMSSGSTPTPLAKRAIQIRLIVNSTPSGVMFSDYFRRALTANGLINIKKDATISFQATATVDVNVLSNQGTPGSTVIKQGSSIQGGVGYINTQSEVSWSGGSIPIQVDKQIVPPLDLSYWKKLARDEGSGHYFEEDWIPDANLPGGIYYCVGDITIEKEWTGIGTLVAEGSITVKKLPTLTSPDVAMIAGNEISIKKEGLFYGFLYARNSISFDKDNTIIGGLSMGGSFESDKDLSITWTGTNQGIPGFSSGSGSGSLSVKQESGSWEEIAP